MSTFLNSFDDSKRALAKLMARENITVQVMDGLTTADFNTVTRILRIPNWPSLTPDQTDMLIGHEVGHALFTDFSYIEKLLTRRSKGEPVKGLMTYFNVIEDTRIERKMRNAFPGLRRSFYAGYQEFMKSGPIFMVNSAGEFVHPVTNETMAPAKMRLIDRINMHYKVGAFLSIPFAADEMPWLAKIDACVSQDDALTIAIALHTLAKDRREQQARDQNDQQGDSASSKNTSDKKDKKDKKDKSDKKSPKADQSEDQDGGDLSDDDTEGADASDGEQENNDRESDASESDSDSDASGESDDDGADESDAEGAESDSENDGSARGDDDGADDAADDADGPVETGTPTNGAHTPNQAKRTQETDPTSFTDDANRTGLADAASSSDLQEHSQKIVHLLIKPLTETLVRERTTSATEWADDVCQRIDAKVLSGSADLATFLKTNEAEWNAAYLGTAKHMSLEFGRRKTAKNLARVKIGKTGKINPGKLHSYKFSDDLFLRSMTVPNGQSHGIVMIIDASGSMQGVFGDVLNQVLLFANFAKTSQIPFECYLFTTCGKTNRHEYSERRECPSMGAQTLTLPPSGRLVGLINTAQGNFKKQMRAVHTLRIAFQDYNTQTPGACEARSLAQTLPYSSLASTPLFAGLLIGERHLERMKRTLKLDKMINVVITDGQDCENLFYEKPGIDGEGKATVNFEYAGSSAMVVRDTVTKKNHVLVEEYLDTYSNRKSYVCPNNALLQLLLDVNKERHGARNVFIFIQPGGGRKRSWRGTALGAMQYLTKMGIMSRTHSDDQLVAFGITDEAITKSFTEHSQYVLPAKAGVADLVMVIPTTSLKLHDTDFEHLDVTNMTQRKIASSFVKSLTLAKTNRVFVNTVIPFIA